MLNRTSKPRKAAAMGSEKMLVVAGGRLQTKQSPIYGRGLKRRQAEIGMWNELLQNDTESRREKTRDTRRPASVNREP
jgi:hypothetical protein